MVLATSAEKSYEEYSRSAQYEVIKDRLVLSKILTIQWQKLRMSHAHLVTALWRNKINFTKVSTTDNITTPINGRVLSMFPLGTGEKTWVKAS